MNLLNTRPRGNLVAAVISGCIAMSAPALAAATETPPHAAFSVRGVDFTSPRAVAHLKHRLGRVATRICMPDLADHLLMNADESACFAAAYANGLAQIDTRRQQALGERTIRLADAHSDGISPH